jgi:LysM repeat protein
LAVVLILSGCGGGQEADPTSTPEPSDPFTSPIVTFGETPTLAPEDEDAYPPSVYLNPSTVTLSVGETATLEVWAEGAGALQTIRLELSFAPDVVDIVDANPDQSGVQVATGDLMEPAQVTTNEVTVGETGRIVYEVRRGNEGNGEGNGAVASITVRGRAEGGAPLQFQQVTALDAAGTDLGIMPLSDGLITVMGEAGSAATPEPAATAATEEPVPAATQETVAPPTSATGGIYYVVQPGENLFRIGLKFGSSADAIASASNIADPSQVSAGTMVLVPTPPPQGTYGYYVQSQDTVYSIASRFGMTVEELATLNNLGASRTISLGQILVVTP